MSLWLLIRIFTKSFLLAEFLITAHFTNMRILKFKSQLTIEFFAAVNYLNGPLRKQMGAIHSTKLSGNFGPKLNGSVRSNRKSFEKTGPPFEVVHFSRSDRLEFWLNGSRPKLYFNGFKRSRFVICDWWISIRFVCFCVLRFVACDRNYD